MIAVDKNQILRVRDLRNSDVLVLGKDADPIVDYSDYLVLLDWLIEMVAPKKGKVLRMSKGHQEALAIALKNIRIHEDGDSAYLYNGVPVVVEGFLDDAIYITLADADDANYNISTAKLIGVKVV